MSPDDQLDQLGRLLRRRAEDVRGASIELDEVRRTAGRIRRRRAAGAVAACAVVLAVGAGGVFAVGGGTDRAVPPPSASGTAEVPRTVELDLAALPEGGDAQLPVVVDDAVVMPDGTRLDDVVGAGLGLAAIQPYGDGFIASLDSEPGTYELDAAGATPLFRIGSPSLASAPDGRLAWITSAEDGSDEVLHVGRAGAELWTLPLDDQPFTESDAGGAAAVGFVGDEVVVSLARTSDTSDGPTLLVGPDGWRAVATRQVSAVDAAHRRVLSRTVGVGCSRSCVVAPLDDGEPLWEDLDVVLDSFDPSGDLVLGGRVVENGGTDLVLDAATGATVLDLVGAPDTQTFIGAGAWESAGVLLVPVAQTPAGQEGSSSALVRVDVRTGEVELATPVLPYVESAALFSGMRYRVLG